MICSLRVDSSKPESRKRVGSFTPPVFIFLFLLFLQICTFVSRRDGLKCRLTTLSAFALWFRVAV